MKHKIFISYASSDTDISENLKSKLEKNYGIKTWVYSRDRTLAAETWKEIETKIREVELVIFIVSKNTPEALGQQQELELALKNVGHFSGTEKIIPIVIQGTDFKNLPEILRNKNGFEIDCYNVRSVAWKIASSAFPSLVKKKSEKLGRLPIPGEWLEISNLDAFVEQHFDIGDRLYFRSVSPMGLLECYAPKIKSLFWVAPENVSYFNSDEEDKKPDAQVPMIFQVNGMIKILQLGWEVYNKNQKDGD